MPLQSRMIGRGDNISSNPARYQFSRLCQNPGGSGLMSISAAGSGPILLIRSILVVRTRSNTGSGSPFGLWRKSALTGGTLITAADIPKLDTNAPDATAEIRVAPGIDFPTTHQMYLGYSPSTATGLGGPLNIWEVIDEPDVWVLRADEGLIFDPESLDTDDQYGITVCWEELL